MPSGEAHRLAQRGLGWPGLMLLLAVMGAGLAVLGSSWSLQAQRGREAELRFRGEQIRAAIGRYVAARSPAEWPPTLEALLDDRREGITGTPRHHLRRLWADPFTGRPDWVLIPAKSPGSPGAAGIAGVHSRSDARRLAEQGVALTEPGALPRVSDWRFVHAAPPPAGNTTRGGTR